MGSLSAGKSMEVLLQGQVPKNTCKLTWDILGLPVAPTAIHPRWTICKALAGYELPETRSIDSDEGSDDEEAN